MKNTVALGAIALFCSIAVSGWAQPTITDLGVFAGGEGAAGYGVDADGAVAVGFSQVAGTAHAFRWTVQFGLMDLGALPGFTSAGARAVSDDGSVVAGMLDPFSGSARAFRWTQAGGMENLGVLPGGNLTRAFGISGDGATIVGYGYGPGRGFRWTQAEGLQSTGTLPGGSYSEANDTNYDGSVIVGLCNSFPGHAARWTLTTGWQDLGTLVSGNVSEANAVSGDGQVVVGYNNVPMTGPSVAFRWTQSGGMQNLGGLPGATDTQARAANYDGSIVVGASSSMAFRWTSAEGMVNLNTWLQAQGVNTTGWVLTSAEDISPDGSCLVGSGTYNGQSRAWLVSGIGSVPAAPTSFSMFRGSVFSGNLASLIQSDDSRLILRPGVTLGSQEAPIQMIVNSLSPVASPSKLEFFLEAQASSSNLTQSIALWNYDSQTYENLTSRPTTTADSTAGVVISSDVDRFIGPNLELKARVSYKAFGPTLLFPWQARLDQVKWRLTD